MDIFSDVHSLQLIVLCRLSKSAPEILWSVRGFVSDSPLQQIGGSHPAVEIAKVTLRSWAISVRVLGTGSLAALLRELTSVQSRFSYGPIF
jgi:hypothetical protein